ncbi:MAG TPA: adenylate/guanylate cyclase domain-containing protein [Spirochaetota bacterium]|nr:adenylate/guanylate cyclase domain-containing protein [Spirochaetota bacterium]
MNFGDIIGVARNFIFTMKIRTKLISIISLIIVTALSGMIFLASYFFRSDNKLRIEESNHKISEVTALKVRADFLAVVEKLNIMGTTMLQDFPQKKLFTDLFFTNDKDFIFAGIAAGSAGSPAIAVTRSIANAAFLAENQMTPAAIDAITRTAAPQFARSFGGEAVVQNLSDSFKMPVIGISIPFQRDGTRVATIAVAYLKLDRFLQAFRQAGITETFMVNDQGDIIAHSDSKIVLSRGNYLALPIVQRMMKSKYDNEQTRYRDTGGVYHLGSFKKIGFSGIGIVATVPEEKAFQAVYSIQRRNIYIMIIFLNLAILVVFFFSKTLTTPLVRLVGATAQIEQGNFRVDIAPTSGDEIGQLTRSFVSMGQGLEERERLKDTFGKFVNKEIAEQVLKGEIKLGGERKTACIFFSDIRSFTAISEKLEPEEVVEFLNEYMTRMVQCVNNTNGNVDKFIGDAIMAVWGAPISHGNDTANAVNGALMMRNELMGFNRGRGGDKKPIIKIGCGINTGPVLAGQIGSDERMEYTVIGDTVNLASRIEALNKPFGTDILISEDSYAIVKDLFVCEPMQKIKVKGKSEPQQIYAVLGRMNDPSAPKSLDDLRAMLGIEMKGKPDAAPEEEVKYEIIE